MFLMPLSRPVSGIRQPPQNIHVGGRVGDREGGRPQCRQSALAYVPSLANVMMSDGP